MASNANNRIINYTDLTYQDITSQVEQILRSDERFKNYNEGELAQIFMQLFAGIADMLNYNIERASEEVYIDTAKRYRSAVKLSRNLNYDIKRPIPATAKVKFTVDRNTTGTTKIISIPQFTSLTYNGLNYVTGEAVTITVNPSDTLVESREVEILQGEFKTIRFPGLNNAQLNRQYQRYYIDDPTFANFYGEKDYKYGDLTIVGLGDNTEDALNPDNNNLYEIRRTSLLASDKIDEFTFNPTGVAPRFKLCLLRTSGDSEDGRGMELRFGDGTFIDNGLKNTLHSIFVRYFSTTGSRANALGVSGNGLSINNDNSISFDGLSRADLSTVLTTNITGGGDLESVESIEANAPGVFQSFDRLVTKLDYVSYLKSLTSPFDINNAIAWGEQEELDNLNFHQPETVNQQFSKPAIKKLFNVILFSAIGKLYNQNVDTGNWEANQDYRSIVVDDDLSTFRYPSQNYINILGAEEVVGQLYFQQEQFNTKFTVVDLVGDQNDETVYYKGYPNFYGLTMPVDARTNWTRDTTAVEQDVLGFAPQVTVSASGTTQKFRDIPMEFTISVRDTNGVFDDIDLVSDQTLSKELVGVGTFDWFGQYVCRKPYLEASDGINYGLVLNPDDSTGDPDEVLEGLLGKILDADNDYFAPYYTAWGDIAQNIQTILNKTLEKSVYATNAGLSFSVNVNIEQDTNFIGALREKIRNYHNSAGSISLREIQNDRLGLNYTKFIQFGITLNSNNADYDEFNVSIEPLYDEVEKGLCIDKTPFNAAVANEFTCVNGETIDDNAYYYGMVTEFGYDVVQKDEVKGNLFNFKGKSSFTIYNNDDYSDELSFVENLSNLITSLDDKAQLTCRHIYVSPIIQTFKVSGNINMRSGVNGDDTLRRMKDRFYQWADDNVDYAIDVYKSNIIDVINSFNEVQATNITLEPYNILPKPFGRKYYFDYESFANGTHYVFNNLAGYIEDSGGNFVADGSMIDKFQEIVYWNVDAYLKKYRLNDPTWDEDVKYVSNPDSPGYQPGWPKCQNNSCYNPNSSDGTCYPSCPTGDCPSIGWSCAAEDPNYGGQPTPPAINYDPRYDSSTPDYDPALYGNNFTLVAESNELYSDVLWNANNPANMGNTYYTEDKVWYWSNEITERTFLYELVNGIVKDCTGRGRQGIGPVVTTDQYDNKRFNITKMPEFYAFINELHLDFDAIIKSNIVNVEGDIAPIFETVANTYGIRYKRRSSGGFSLSNEIPQFIFDVDYVYV